MPAMNLLTRYVVRQIVTVMLTVTVGLTLAIWLSQSLRFLDIIINRGLPAGLALYFLTLMLPSLLTIILPLALFVAVLFVYFRLITDSELVVARSAGASNLALARPALIVATATGAICLFLTAYGMPASMQSFAALQRSIQDDYSQILIEPGVFSEATDGVMVFARERSSDGGLHGVIVQDVRNEETQITYTAAVGAFVASGGGPRIVLENGTYQEEAIGSRDVSVLYFDRVVVKLAELGGSSTAGEMKPQQQFLGDLMAADHESDELRQRMRAEGHQRIVAPIYTVIFVLVALATLLHGSISRFGRPLRLGIAIAAVAGLQGGSFALQSLTARMPELVPAMYIVPFAAGGISLLALLGPWRLASRAQLQWPTSRRLSPA
jgi:lipopolysaccharide export system permease protein